MNILGRTDVLANWLIISLEWTDLITELIDRFWAWTDVIDELMEGKKPDGFRDSPNMLKTLKTMVKFVLGLNKKTSPKSWDTDAIVSSVSSVNFSGSVPSSLPYSF